MKQNINIEAEGNELILKNKAGDYVIIPKKYRLEVQDMIKENCYDCIDKLVETLPVMEDYAEDGSLLPSWNKVKSVLNPRNWGVDDYTDKGDFNTAYSSARKAGEKEFMWNNTRFSTTMKNLPGERITERDDFGEKFLSSLANEFVKGEHKVIGNLLFGSDALKNRSEEYGDVYDLYNYYLGQPLESNTLSKSKYFPSNAKNNFENYIAVNDPKFIEEVINIANEYNIGLNETELVNASANKDYNPFLEPAPDGSKEGDTYIDRRGNKSKYGKSLKQRAELKNKYKLTSALRNFRVGRGKDERGEYISYYDLFDRGTGLHDKNSKTFNVAKPFEVYDRIYVKDYGDSQKKRMYYSDKELSELDIDKKNFDTLALQKELSNRGYKLPKSTKKDGTFDGVWGDETKNALLEYRKSQK